MINADPYRTHQHTVDRENVRPALEPPRLATIAQGRVS